MQNSTLQSCEKIWPSIAPTEIDNQYRHRADSRRGARRKCSARSAECRDTPAFSAPRQISRFCQMLLNGGVYAHQRILRRATIAEFTAPQQLSGGTRTLGWAVPPKAAPAATLWATHLRHTGFTGTSIWIDPDRQLLLYF